MRRFAERLDLRRATTFFLIDSSFGIQLVFGPNAQQLRIYNESFVFSFALF